MTAARHIPIVKEAICEPGGARANEDHLGSTECAAWVVDGVSGLDPVLVDGEPAPRWFSRCFSKHLATELSMSPDDSTLEIINRCLSNCIVEWDGAGMGDSSHPAATFAMVRVMSEEIELVCVGDCSIRYRLNDERVVVFADRSVEPFENLTTNRLRKLQEEHPTLAHRELVQLLKPSMRNNRKFLNKVDGYNALTLSLQHERNMVSTSLPLSASPYFLITSDGFSRYSDLLKIGSDNEMLEAAASAPLNELLQDIRNVENGDFECREFPRVKKSDDATALWVEIALEAQS